MFCWFACVCKILVTSSEVGSLRGAKYPARALITVVKAEAISGGTSIPHLVMIQTRITDTAPARAPLATFGVSPFNVLMRSYQSNPAIARLSFSGPAIPKPTKSR